MGNDNDLDPALYEPHYLTITFQDQVQIFEAIIGNTDCQVTTTLLRASGHLKDNRILPLDFRLPSPEPDIAVRGAAETDPDFGPGGDAIRYDVEVGSAKGPFTVTVELLCQTAGYRWVQNLGRLEGPEISRMPDYNAGFLSSAVVVSSEILRGVP